MNELKLTLSLEEINLLLNALGELPFRVSNGLIAKVKKQAEAQIEPLKDESI